MHKQWGRKTGNKYSIIRITSVDSQKFSPLADRINSYLSMVSINNHQ